MKSSAKKIELASVDDLFSTEEGRQDAKLEKIQEIPLSELHPFKNHPFKVKDDEAMMETADSIKQYGVLVPAIARPDPEGGYELVERFWDSTRWMIEFSVLRSNTVYGRPGDEMRLFLTEDGYQAALQSQQRREIKIKRYARVIEGHVLDVKKKRRK